MMRRTFFAIMLIAVFSVLPVHAASTWPAASQGTNIGASSLAVLAPLYEPSGVAWHSGRQQLLVVSDEGQLAAMNLDGSNVTIWNIGGDLEGVTVPDGSSNLIYLGVEKPDSIVEFDLSTGMVTGKSWNLETWMVSADANLGLEALAYANGLFYAGLQLDGTIHVFNVDRAVSGSVSQTAVLTPAPGRTDISDLSWSAETSTMYALFDGANILTEMKTDGTVLAEYSVPGTDQEGVVVLPGCSSTTSTIVIAEDNGPRVIAYGGYPISCPAPVPEPVPTPALAIVSVTGVKNGDVKVIYSDSTTKTYDVFAIKTNQLPTVTRIESTNDYLVTIWKRAAVINAIDGTILGTRFMPKSYSTLWTWALGLAGL